jgi:putative ABC transport system permease protein
MARDVSPRPPRLAALLLRMVAHRGDRRFVLDDLAEEFARLSMDQGAAAARAWYWRQTFGSLAPLAGDRSSRSIRAAGALRVSPQALVSDLGQAARWLRRHPGTAATVVATMTIAFGAVLAAFSIINTVLMRPLPFKSPDRIVDVWATGPTMPRVVRASSRPNFEDWRDRARSFAALAAHTPFDARLTGRGDPRVLDGVRVTQHLDTVLGIQPVLGRMFDVSDYSPGSAPVAILTYSFWRSEFARDPSVLQQALTIDGRQHRIVGVLPDLNVAFPRDPHSVWIPLIPRADAFWEHSRGTGWLSVVGRVKDDVEMAVAQAEMNAIVSQMAGQYPDTNRGRTEAVLAPIADAIVGPLAPMLQLLGAALVAVLLVACANLANLLIVSVSRRQREFAVRSAIGGAGARLARQVLAETALMCCAAAALGLALSPILVRAFVAVFPGSLPRTMPLGIDGPTLLAAIALGAASSLLLGVPQAIHARRINLGRGLAMSTRTTSGGRSRFVRGALVTSQVALSFVLIVAGTAFVRTLDRLTHVKSGYRPEGVLIFSVAPSPEQTSGTAALQFYEAVVNAIREIPGVRSAAASVAAPMATGGWRFGIRPPGATADVLVGVNLTTPAYFDALGIRLLEGRLLTDDEQRRGVSSAVVSEPLAKLLGGKVIGSYFDYSNAKWQIVGVVEGVRHSRPRDEPLPELIIPWHLAGRRAQSIVVRAEGDPMALLPAIAARVHSLDPTAPLSDVARLEDRLRLALAAERFRATLLAALAAIAVALAALGAYSVTAYAVAYRTREYGIRMALGEQPASIARRALATALVPSALGVIAGGAIAVATSKWIEAFLYEVQPLDAITLTGAAAALLLLALLAGTSSARRAATIDPSRTLTAE